MQSRKKIEKFVADIDVATDAGIDREVLADVLQAHRDSKQEHLQNRHPQIWRTAMRHKRTRVAAVIVLAVLLAGVFSLTGGSVAFSQVGHAVSSTLTRLKEMIMEIRTGEIKDRAPLPPAASAVADRQAPAPNLRAVMCTARYFKISENEQTVWQSLKDRGIEPIQASAAPETYYAALDREQMGQLEDALTISPITSPRFIVAEGQEAMIGTDVFALAWLPTVSSDGVQIESTFSFHDGENGFEVPNVSTEEGGGVLVRVRGIIPTGEDTLILLEVQRQ